MKVCYPIVRNRSGQIVWSGAAFYSEFVSANAKSAVEDTAMRRAERACIGFHGGTPDTLWQDGSGEISAGRLFTRVTP